MPGHVRAADAPEDLWRCHECGWTYPNHHPSAKHRRHHKMQCGNIPGFMKVTDLKLGPQVVTGSSSDGCSSDEDHLPLSSQARKNNGHLNGHHQALPQSPSQVAASNIEQVCSNNTDPTPSYDGVAQVIPKINGKAALPGNGSDLPTSKVQNAGPPQVSGQGHRSLGSAHAVKGQWSCRHCGWLYPNAHPSAKSRRKHKKICGVPVEHSLPGGSSDEASSSDEEKHCEHGTKELAETQETLECDPNVSQESLAAETISEVSSMELQSHRGMTGREPGRELADHAQEIPLESDSSYSQVPNGATGMHGVFESNGQEKLEVGDSHVALVDEGNVQPTEQKEQTQGASGAPNASDGPVFCEISKRTVVSEELKPSMLDGAVTDQQPLDVSSEQLQNQKPDLSHPTQQNFTLENGHRSINDVKKTDDSESSSSQSQSPVILGTDSLKGSVDGSPRLDVNNQQPRPTKRAAVGGESPANFEARSSPESPEGLVRSRVEIYEKLAATSPRYLSPRMTSVSPTTNSASPRIRKGTTYPNGAAATGSNGHAKDVHEMISHLGNQPSNAGWAHSASKQDGPSELQGVRSHLLHRGNFVQIECNQVSVGST